MSLKLHRIFPFGYAEPLPRPNQIWFSIRVHFALNLWGCLSLRAALRGDIRALNAFAAV